MSKFIDFKRTAFKKESAEHTDSFPGNLLEGMLFNEIFGQKLDYHKLGDDNIKGIFAWMKATDALANWDILDHEPEWIKILSEHYKEGKFLSKISLERRMEFDCSDLDYWFKIMRFVGIKYGFPLWVVHGSRHTIKAKELIELQCSYAKAFYEMSAKQKYPMEETVENLFPVYCLNVKDDPGIDVQKQSEEELSEYVSKCELEIIRNCGEFKDILKGDNWLNGKVEDRYYISSPADPDDVICTIEQRTSDGLEW